MKKITKSIKNLFRHIGLFFDKWLITPITKIILRISEFFKANSKNVERFLGKKQTLIVISLLLAFGIFLILDGESNTLIDQYAEILYNQPVTATYNEEAYVIEGLPKSVDITLVGQKRHIFLAKQSPSGGVTVDLTGLKPGTHKVTLKYSQRLKSLDYRLDPSEINVTIYEKVSQTKALTTDILHKDSLDTKLNIENVELDRSEVIVKGAAYKLEQVASVKALIDVDNLANPTAGDVTLDNVALKAYDTDGKVMNVEIVPKTVKAKVTITSPSKEVPLKIVPNGELAFGKSIKSMSSSINNVTIYGSEEVLSSIDSIPVEINVDGLNQDKDFTVTLQKPTGVTEISQKTVTVKVTVDNLASKEFAGIHIATENLNEKYKVQAVTEADSMVTVVVKGSKDIIDGLENSSIHPYIDLKGFEPGTHEVEVKVSGDDVRLSYSSKTKKVKVTITEK